MIVHTLKMCTGDAGPEQSLVLFMFKLWRAWYNITNEFIDFFLIKSYW